MCGAKAEGQEAERIFGHALALSTVGLAHCKHTPTMQRLVCIASDNRRLPEEEVEETCE